MSTTRVDIWPSSCVQNHLSAYELAVLASGPVAYWPMQECYFPLRDYSGNRLHMLPGSGLYQMRLTDQPITGPRLYSFGSAGGWDMATTAVATTVTDNFSIEMWIKLVTPYVTLNDQNVIYNGSGGSDGWGVLFDANDTFQYLAGGVAVGASSSAISRDAWHHIVVVRDAGTWKYYIDGAIDTASAGTHTPNTPTGTVETSASAIQRRYCHIAIYDVALTATDVSDHYTAA